MSAAVAVPQISARNRLELTLFVAAALHAVIILGVGFGLDQLIPRDPVQRMEITLVHSRSDSAPDDAKLLAQANQKGGGDLDKAARPTSPASTPAGQRRLLATGPAGSPATAGAPTGDGHTKA